MQPGQPTKVAPRLKHPFLFGSSTAILLGVATLYLLQANELSFQSPLAAIVVPILVFGYFPITLVVSPVIVAIATRIRYGNTNGLWWYFGGSAIFGFIFSILIWGILFVGFVLSGPP
jgi:hypothetical protein